MATTIVVALNTRNGTTARPPPVHREGLDVVNVHLDAVASELTVVGWILLASFAKLLFNLSRRLSTLLPDSALLIVLGIICGLVLTYRTNAEDIYHLEAHTFFIFLLPPIVFDAGYSLALWGVSKAGAFDLEIPLLDLLVFTSIISAVDPVAVIAVFEQVHVNANLYINVFGESLLNDAVAVVLYRLFLSFVAVGEAGIKPADYATGAVSFFVVSVGGFLVGVLAALVTAFTTRFTHHISVLVPVFVFLIPYLGYLVAEMFGLSAIIAIVFCGLLMKPYVRENISLNASSAVKYYTKMLATAGETVVFMFLGLALFAHSHYWDFAFIGVTLVFALIFRAIGVIVLCALVNRFRVSKFSAVDQLVMSYGGLRGAIAYGLVQTLPESVVGKDLFLTATIVLILFTVFVQVESKGTTVRPLVHWLKVRREVESHKTMQQHMFDRLSDFTMAGIESIVEKRGKHYAREMFRVLNAEVLRPLLVRKEIREVRIVGKQAKPLFQASADPSFLRNLKLIEIRDVVEGARKHRIHPEGTKPIHKVQFQSFDSGVDVPAVSDYCDTENALRGYFYSRNPDRSDSRLDQIWMEEWRRRREEEDAAQREADAGSLRSVKTSSSTSSRQSRQDRPGSTMEEEKKKVHTFV